MQIFKKEKIYLFLKLAFPVMLLILAAIEIQKFAGGLDIGLIWHEVSQIHLAILVIVLLSTFAALIPMLFYDVVIVRLLKIEMPTKKLVKYSLIVNSFSNLIGFGGLVGAMLRTYFYRAYEVDKRKLLKTIAFVSLYYLTGISLLSWILLAGYREISLLLTTKWLYLAVIVVASYLPIILISYTLKRKTEHSVDLRTRLQLIFVSFLEWTAVFLAVWLLALVMKIPIRFDDLFPVFIVASCAGIVSMIPGGLGSFDLVFIWGTHELGIQDEKIIALLILYRIGYFFIPFFFGVVLFLKEYWDKWNQSWDNLPNALIQRASHVLLTIMVFLSGLILLLSAAVPGITQRLTIAEELLSLPIMNISHQLSVATGFILLGLSRGIEYKVKRAYNLTFVVLALAALFSLFKGLDYEEASFLLIVALLLRISKTRFYRESYVLTWGKTIIDVMVIIFITSMYLLIGYVNLPSAKIIIPKKLMPYVITDYRDLFYSALIGLIIALLVLAIGYLIKKPRKWVMTKSFSHEDNIVEHINKYNGNVLTHLIFLHDKYIFWNNKKNVLFSFQKYADKLVVLGDPIGEKADFLSAIEEFQQISDLHGFTPVYYEVSNGMLPTLHGNGYDFFKFGEEGFVNLESFSLTGKKMKGARAVKNKFERENFIFEIVAPPFSNELMKELNEVSDDWLQGRSEKGFSLGYFDVGYLNKNEIAIMKSNDSRIIGFANLMPVYDDNQTISVDLMRFRPGSPSGTMDFIFLSLFEWAKEKGYQHFNLGMAPLSNVGLSKFSFLSEKIASQIYLHGQFVYHFQGLRKFKEKYADVWEPKYLAFRKKSSLPFTMAQVALLIGKKRA
ncbi:bifunctional lysylphosphatidylglycerol flippase/synthetase MprF [Bacillus sp. FJAT-29790]|uniref:bifunctional lysylphosphatidylglycerol flippase/synthetase MprF n=1 Tax=Bacillus sp. FJAT-29790 TaxID=1895002 RepID=UPI001C234D1A|nr:bifunctional lysylphosphatidylglycerol flippase/synthetase MprF [Bacillus sp. FJAT-29790]MBU8878443.1 bifunctional lysylphosphatidylglycerol flippase/synthetase MprF [Bacillus sp. FJAT-29790]